MPINGQSAQDGFLGALGMVEALLTIEQSFEDPPSFDNQGAVTGLRGSAAVLMVASFETLLANLFEEQLAILSDGILPIMFNKLPKKLQEKTVFGTLERAMKGPLFEDAISRFDRIPSVKQASYLVYSNNINPAAFCETGGNPNSKRVKEMFKDVGISDIFQLIRPRFDAEWNKAESQDFLANKLDEIVQKRHVVAHRADALSLTRLDLHESLEFLKLLGRLLDHHLSVYCTEVIRVATTL